MVTISRLARLFPRRWMFVTYALVGQALMCATCHLAALSWWTPFAVFVAVYVFPVALYAAVLDFFGA